MERNITLKIIWSKTTQKKIKSHKKPTLNNNRFYCDTKLNYRCTSIDGHGASSVKVPS